MEKLDVQKTERKRRDPVERRRVIVEAAGHLLLKEGMQGFTHRKVAALANVPLGSTTQYFATLDDLSEAGLLYLADQTEESLQETECYLKAHEVTPEAIASCIHGYAQDSEQVRIGALFYAAAANSEQLRTIAQRWHDGFVELFSAFMSEDAARAIALFADGVYMQASIDEEPIRIGFLTACISALISGTSERKH